MENPPVYRVQRREPGDAAVQRVDRLRLLTPGEREEARRQREERRERNRNAAPKQPAQGPDRGVDYTA